MPYPKLLYLQGEKLRLKCGNVKKRQMSRYCWTFVVDKNVITHGGNVKNIAILLAFTALLTVSIPSFSDCSGYSCTNVTVTRIVVRPYNLNVQIRTSGDESKLSCDAASDYINLGGDQPNYDSTYALLLTAHTTQHPITIRTTAEGECVIQYVVSDH